MGLLDYIQNKIEQYTGTKTQPAKRSTGNTSGTNTNKMDKTIFPTQKNVMPTLTTTGSTLELIQEFNLANQKVIGKVDGSTLPKETECGIDYSSVKNGSYNILGYKEYVSPDGKKTLIPDAIKLDKSYQSKQFSNSEGVDRRIETIKVSGKLDKTVQQELIAIGKKEGFTVETLNGGKNAGVWVEDYSNFRPDGKVMTSNENIDTTNTSTYISDSRRNAGATSNPIPQGQVAKFKFSSEYSQHIQDKDLVKGGSYLEGGNVLTTCKADGSPAAIIGQESLETSRAAMQKQYEQMHKGKTKVFTDDEVISQIAKDLGTDKKNITFIPQYDFHIDMCYRPLKNGEIAVPDYKEAIKILQTQKLDGVSELKQQNLLNQLIKVEEKTRSTREAAEKKLQESGYKLVKLPCFANMTPKVGAQTNYMNAVCGTGKNNDTFYITNKSDLPALDSIIQKYLHNAGIDNVYFVSTTNYLRQEGGIDCLTKEPAKKI